jgi:hypothetical protein
MDEFKTTRREFAKLLIGSTGMPLSGLAGTEAHAVGQRVIVSLDGEWSIEEGTDPEKIPTTFGHTVPVPGLAHSANPAFPGVDEYQNREYVLNMIRRGLYQPSEDTGVLGRTSQKRNYFWYRKSFRAPVKKLLVILKTLLHPPVGLYGLSRVGRPLLVRGFLEPTCHEGLTRWVRAPSTFLGPSLVRHAPHWRVSTVRRATCSWCFCMAPMFLPASIGETLRKPARRIGSNCPALFFSCSQYYRHIDDLVND